MQRKVTVVVPTLAGGESLAKCVASLRAQTLGGVRVVVVDNSGRGVARGLCDGCALIENERNEGFGGAVNQGFRAEPAEYLATLNDDAEAEARWLEEAIGALERHAGAGMAASRIVLKDTGRIDSAGMVVARDGSSKQRGHGERAELYEEECEALLPSGCAAVYRAAMLEQTGLFEDSFFLYCEDTDLGLRGWWAGWSCVYAPRARVEHGYSRSAGRASEQKAWLVERNRLRVVARCFPAGWVAAAPFYAAMRYFWHVWYLVAGRGKGAEYAQGGGSGARLAWLVVKAHLDLARSMAGLLRSRRGIINGRRAEARTVAGAMRRHLIGVRKVAEL